MPRAARRISVPLARHRVAESGNETKETPSPSTIKIAKTSIPPAALRYQTELANNAAAVKAAGLTGDSAILKQVTELIGRLQAGIVALETTAAKHVTEGVLAEAKQFCTSVLPAMLKVREAADSLEAIVEDDIWPLPTFQEILFIK